MLYLCRFGRIPLSVHWSTLAMAFAVALVESSFGAGEFESWMLFALALVPCLLHTIGTLLVLLDYEDGQQSFSVVIWPFGGSLHPRSSLHSNELSSYQAEAASVLSGITFLFFGCILSFLFPLNLSPESAPLLLVYSREFLLGYFLLHLTPIYPFAGQIIVAALQQTKDSEEALVRARQIEGAFVVVVLVASLIFTSISLAIWGVIALLCILSNRVRRDVHFLLSDKRVSDIMVPVERVPVFTHGTTVTAAARTLIEDPSPVFFVFAGEKFLGLVTRERLRKSLAALEEDSYIRDAVSPEVGYVRGECSVNEFISRHGLRSRYPFVVISEDGTPLGLLTGEHLYDRLLYQRLAPQERTPISREKSATSQKPRDSRLD